MIPVPSFLRAPRRALAMALLAGSALAGAACSENLESGGACPALCPLQNEQLRDTVVEGIVLDTTLAGFPLPGDAAAWLLAVKPAPDSIDTRMVVRFDSIPARFFPSSGGDSVAITAVDSARLLLRLDTANTRFTAPITVEAYDVEVPAGQDTSNAALVARFTPDRRLGAVTVEVGGITGDTLRVPVANQTVLARAGGRLRIGLRVSSTAAATMRVWSSTGTAATLAPQLVFFSVETATTGTTLSVTPNSTTPAPSERARTFRDFPIVAASPRTAPGSDLGIGGVPARRTFLRFDVPRRIADSTTIVRASLELVQRSAGGFVATDSVVMIPQAIYASDTTADLLRLASFSSRTVVDGGTARLLDSLKLSPTGTGTQILPLVNAVRAWRFLPTGTQRAIVLRSSLEGAQVGELRFLSSEAPAAQRPRLRITYLPHTSFGLP